MTENPPHNLRHYSRIAFDVEVMLSVKEREFRVHLIDIALKGALVETSEAQGLVLHAPCRLVLALAHGAETITLVGHIAHLQGQHVGIECLEIDINSLTLLRRLIELNTGDPQRIHQELCHLFARTWVA